ncbi:hypothetical protein R6Q57_022824 [Mikania cordata]
MADVAGHHGGAGGDEPPHRHPYRVPTSYESCKLLLNRAKEEPMEKSELIRQVSEEWKHATSN